MASRRSVYSAFLSKEFECPLCCDEYKDPKVLGECQHSICKSCLHMYLAPYISKKAKRFPCPMCRAKCLLPKNGAEGLKDNFTLKSIMTVCNNACLPEPSVAAVGCGACRRNSASHLCTECDGTYLCESCLKAHSLVAGTADHEAIGLCENHYKPLNSYCETCKCTICHLCLIAEHSQSTHDIRSYKDVVASIRDALVDVASEFEHKVAHLDQALAELHNIHEEATGRAEMLITAVTEKADKAIGCAEKEMRDIEQNVDEMTTRIKELKCEKQLAEERYDTVQALKDEVYEKKVELTLDVRKQADICSKDMVATLEQMEDIRSKMKSAAEKWESLKSLKCIDASTYDILKGVNSDMVNLSNLADSFDAVAPFRNITKRFAEFVPDPNDLGLGYLSREFSSASKTVNLYIPTNKEWRTLTKVIHLPNSRIAAVGRAQKTSKGPVILYFWRLPSTSPCSILRETDPVVDMAATSSGNLVLLRKRNPLLRVLLTNGGGRDDIAISLDETRRESLCSIDTDDRDHYFIMYGTYPQRHVLVVDKTGKIVQDVSVVCATHMSFCRSTNLLFVVTTQVIIKLHWKSTIPRLEMLSSSPHGSGLDCRDLCASNNGGEVFALFHRSSDPADVLRVYQLLQQKGGIKEKMKEVDILQNEIISSNFTSLSVRDDLLILSYADCVEVFNLTT